MTSFCRKNRNIKDIRTFSTKVGFPAFAEFTFLAFLQLLYGLVFATESVRRTSGVKRNNVVSKGHVRYTVADRFNLKEWFIAVRVVAKDTNYSTSFMSKNDRE